eukprot:TRINITY_DN3565_c0_g1_i3.p1 TRINITY_DN3565_c0_g1~~TRINITY_DN3565_c0_g1_i3.p1  ORF type:complete len:327 (+),score=43.11 TRINITY_DN3565_c0_g1_i3:472-1452(+)
MTKRDGYGKQAAVRFNPSYKTQRPSHQVNKSTNFLHHRGNTALNQQSLSRSGQLPVERASEEAMTVLKVAASKVAQADYKDKKLSVVSEVQEIDSTCIPNSKPSQDSLKKLSSLLKDIQICSQSPKDTTKNPTTIIVKQIKENRSRTNSPLQVKCTAHNKLAPSNSQERVSISQCDKASTKPAVNRGRPQSSPGSPQHSNTPPYVQSSPSIISQASSAATESQTLAEVVQKTCNAQGCPLPKFPHSTKGSRTVKPFERTKNEQKHVEEKQMDLLFEKLASVEKELNRAVNKGYEVSGICEHIKSGAYKKEEEPSLAREIEVIYYKR